MVETHTNAKALALVHRLSGTHGPDGPKLREWFPRLSRERIHVQSFSGQPNRSD